MQKYMVKIFFVVCVDAIDCWISLNLWLRWLDRYINDDNGNDDRITKRCLFDWCLMFDVWLFDVKFLMEWMLSFCWMCKGWCRKVWKNMMFMIDWLKVKSDECEDDEQDNQNNDKPVEFFFEKIFLLLVRTSYILFNFFPIQKHFYMTNVCV